MGKVIFWLAAIVAAALAMQSAVHSQADTVAKEDWSKEFAGGIVPAERMGGDNPNHLMISEHMLNPYFEPVASGVLEFRFSKKGLLGVLRSQRIGETIKPGECPVEHDLIELLVYDPKRHKSYVVFRKQVSHSERGRKRVIGDWGFHRNGMIFQASLPEYKKPGESGTTFGIYWKVSTTSSAQPKLITTLNTNRGSLHIPPDETTSAVIDLYPYKDSEGYSVKRKVQVLDGSNAIELPDAADCDRCISRLSSDGKRLVYGRFFPGPAHVTASLDISTKKLTLLPSGTETEVSPQNETKAETDELRLETVAGQRGDASLYLVSNAKLDPRESARVRLYTGRNNEERYEEDFYASFSPDGKAAAFVAPENDHTCFYVYWTLNPKWTQIYPAWQAGWRAGAVMRALSDYWRAKNKAEGKPEFGRLRLEVPSDPASALRPYLGMFPDALEHFVFTDGPIEGIGGDFVGYYPGSHGVRAVVHRNGNCEPVLPGCIPTDDKGLGAEAFDEY